MLACKLCIRCAMDEVTPRLQNVHVLGYLPCIARVLILSAIVQYGTCTVLYCTLLYSTAYKADQFDPIKLCCAGEQHWYGTKRRLNTINDKVPTSIRMSSCLPIWLIAPHVRRTMPSSPSGAIRRHVLCSIFPLEDQTTRREKCTAEAPAISAP